ncbi:hypothetical protein [Shimazuella alba]|uniref:Uncharacterized protein n=1 Tax=Shimazuella alba TaxID=2690964 RepID=A0A6I4VUB1_9BACL|nr:hypothetical protein [Shimazuella alba]MXQ54118.1 hypothetical protein [Shimazuella alba]
MSSRRDEFLRGLKEAGGEFPSEKAQKGNFRYLVVHTYKFDCGKRFTADDYSGETSVPVANVTYQVINSREVKCELLSKDGKVLNAIRFVLVMPRIITFG